MKFKIKGRYYDPYSTKFLSEDPIGNQTADYNLYRYVKNNPLKFTDPEGLQAAAVGAIVFPIGAVIGGVCIINAQNKLQEISAKKKACLQQFNDRMAACEEKVGPIKDDCVKVATIALMLFEQRAEGQLQ